LIELLENFYITILFTKKLSAPVITKEILSFHLEAPGWGEREKTKMGEDSVVIKMEYVSRDLYSY